MWTSGDLSHTVAGLTDGVGYDVEVRAANTTGPGAWSATASGTTSDHPDRQSAATPLALDSSLPGRIDPADDEDMYKIVTTEDTDLWVYTTGDLDTVGKLTDSRGDVLASNNQAWLPPRPHNFSLRAEVEAGTYYVSVRSNEGAHTGAYRIHAVNVLPVSTDPGEGTLISPDSLTPGRLEREGVGRDVFKIVLTEDTDLLVYSISNISFLVGKLYDEHGSLIVTYIDTGIPDHEPDFVLREQLGPGTYRLEVKAFYPDSIGPYVLYVDAVEDPGHSFATATPLVFESATPGRIDPGDDEDYFSLTLAAPSYVYILGVKHYNKDTPLDIALFDGEGNEGVISVVFRSIRSDTEGSDELGELRFEGARAKLGAGTHYFRITSRDGRPRPYMLFPVVDEESNRFEQDCLMLGSLQGDPPSQSDPAYGCQWHLNNTGQYGVDIPGGGALQDINVEEIWATTKGEGVNVAVIDERVDLVHEDLRDNISVIRSHDYDPELPWFTSRETHGTAVAGIIAARDNNVGGRGVAPRATIYGRRVTLFEAADLIDAMTRDMEEVAVSNNSWGFPDTGAIWFPVEAWEMAVEKGVPEGYGGKGIFYVWAGGNGHYFTDNSNFDSRANHHAVTAVCAISIIDSRSSYSERGSNLWVCAPSSDPYLLLPGITTTHTLSRYRKDFGGTSAAAPIVSGVAALLRSVYPDLTWRDLKLILAGSARHNDPGHEGWEEGALKYGSADERYRFNHNYGFGVVDAGAAMELAGGWTSPPPWREISATSDEAAEIADLGSVATSLTLDPYVGFIEFIAIEPTMSHTFYRDLRMELTSPSGATSIITVRGNIYSRHADPVWVEATPRFGSAKHLGEDAAGEWTLRIADETERDSGMLHSWKLTAYGHGYIPGFPAIRGVLSRDGALVVIWEVPDDIGESAPGDIGESEITGYDLRYVPRDADGGADPTGWTVVEDVSSGSLQHTLSDLDTGARYYVAVRAVNRAGAGPWSESFAAETEAEAPGAPTITGVVSGNKAVTVFWAASGDDGAAEITAYDLRYVQTSADETVEANWTVTEDVWTSGGAYEYELGGLETGVGYDVEIRAVNRVGDGAWSATAMQAPREVPGAPTVGSVTAGPQALTVGWVAPQVTGGSAIKSYDVRHILSDAADKAAANWAVVSGAWTSGDLEYTYTITGLEGGAGYDVGVRAANSVGDGSWSDTVTGTTSPSDDATLNSLTLTGLWLAPAFDSGTMSYNAPVGHTVTQVTVGATSNYHLADVEFLDGDGNALADAEDAAPGHQVDLSVGDNIVGVKVTAQDGVTTLTYTVTVDRDEKDLTLTPAASDPRAPFPSKVTYRLEFHGDWTVADTPDGVPSGAGFTPLIGAVHNAAAVFLRSGGRASPGVEEMAETGGQSTLIDEFREEFDAGNASLRIEGSSYPGPTGTVRFSDIWTTNDHPLVTVLSRIRPTHDWFTGVSGLSLLDASGLWRREHSVDIFPWDAGTEQGNDFSSSPDDETIPRGRITSISGAGPFTTDPIGRVSFVLRKVTTKRTMAENTPPRGAIGLPVTPFTTSGPVYYVLRGTDKDSFNLDNSTGQLRAKPGVTYDRERRDSYTVEVYYSDNHGSVYTTVNITVRNVNEPPAVSGETGIDYPENGTTPVGTYTASDPENDDITWSLAGTDHGDFEISDSGELTFSQKPDYEDPTDSGSNNKYKVTVRAYDGNSYGTRDVVVTVTDVNEAPSVSGNTAVDFAENSDDLVGVYSATDPEEETVTWSLADTGDGGDFELSDGGVLTFVEVPDREKPVDSNGDNVYLVTVQAYDGTRYGTRDVVVTVTDVNEEAVIEGDAGHDYVEGRTGAVGVYSASDPEESPVTLSLVGSDEDVFELSESGSSDSCVSGSCEFELRFRRSPDFESPADSGRDNVYRVEVQAWDGNRYGTRGVVVTVTNDDEDGTVGLSSVQPQVGTVLRAVLSDPDRSVRDVTWVWERSLSSGGGWVTIGGAASDAYTPVGGDERYFLRVTASYSDGEGSGKTAEGVSANRVQAAPFTNTAPVFPSSETGRREVEENTPARRDIGVAVAAVDPDVVNPDVDETLTYRLEGDDAAAFEIDELSGQLRTRAALDFEVKRSYSMRLTVTDTSGEFDRITVRVAVLNVDEPPVLSGPAEVDYAENSRGLVGEFSAVDPEKARIVWTLLGDDADVLEISSGGVLTFGSPPDYETPTDVGEDNTYVVTVEASDGTYTPSPSRRVTVRVTNVEEDGSVTLTPARPEVGVRVSASVVDPDGGISNLVWRWERSPNNRDWVPIPGAGGASYTPTTADRGHYLRVVVTYDDAEGPTKVAAAATSGRVPNPTRPPPPPPPSPPPSPPPGPSSGPGPGPSGGGGPEPLPPGANHPPEFSEGSRTVRMVAENSPAGTDIGAPVTATDPEDDALAYKLAGTAADTFDLDSATGQLKTKAALDYESRNSYTIIVEVRDGKNPEGEADRRRDDSIRVTINIINRDDPGWVTLSAPTPRVDQPLEAVLSDPDGDIADLNWRWERSTDRNAWTPIPDTDGASYTAAAGDEGHYLRVTATYGDPFGPGQAATAAPPNPVTVGHTTTFTDVDPEGVHAPAIEALATDGLFVDTECGEGLFCPDQPIQRQTMAIWLIRILRDDPPTVGESRFADIAHGQWWIRYAEALADRQITLGCATNPPRYCPDRSVTRAQMASFLARALQLPPAPTPAGFTDTEGNTHQANIDALAAAGITLGCDTDPLRYCPDQPVTRAQMATFLHRALNHQTTSSRQTPGNGK